MRPSLVHIIWHLEIGGGEVFLCGLVRELARRGLSQHVFAVGPAGRLAEEIARAGVPVHAFNKSSKLGLATIARMAATLRRLRPSLVQTHGEAGMYWGLPAARLAGARAVSLLYQNDDESLLKTWSAQLALMSAALVVAGSRDVARFAQRRFRVRADRIRTIHCGIDVDAFACKVTSRAHERCPLLLSVGRLVRNKGHRTLIDALVHVRARHPGARVMLVGDGPERAALEQDAARLGVADAVTFAGTVYPTRRVLADADVFVFPSAIEPQGLAVLEAFAAGVPVVASGTGGIPEMLEDERDGLLVPPGDAPALASAICRMLDDEPFRRACTVNARQRAGAFDIATIAEHYTALYDTLGAMPSAASAASSGASKR